MTRHRWTIVLGDEAETDFANILQWTAEQFGPRQAERYADLILGALDGIADAPETALSRDRPEIGAGFRSVHLHRPGRHFILYRQRGAAAVLIVRILHDSMELSRHGRDV